jgi:hypothetical protein
LRIAGRHHQDGRKKSGAILHKTTLSLAWRVERALPWNLNKEEPR